MKQQLMKTFSLSKWMLCFVLALGVFVTSCDDKDTIYDDAEIKKQLTELGDYKGLTEKVANLESALATVKVTAEKAAADAKEALANGTGTGSQAALDKALADIEDIKKTTAKLEQFDTNLDKKLTDYINGQLPIDEIMKKIIEEFGPKLEELTKEVINLVGHRLSSIVYIPEEHINGIAAIKFYSLSYIPQTYVVHPELYPTTKDAGSQITLSSGKTKVRYRLNPRVGVAMENILEPFYNCIVSNNDMTKAVDATLAGQNSPILPVVGSGKIVNDVYEFYVTKSVNENIDREWLNPSETLEKFYMASLAVPLADNVLTAEELEGKEATRPIVHSEYVRLAESTVTPFIKQPGTVSHDGSDDITLPGTPPNDYPHLNEVDLDGRYLHYHDSTSLYKSGKDQLIDHKVDWKAGIDLKTIVDVCILERNHESLDDYKSYGLEYRFYLPTVPYMQGNNLTDQQQFAVIDNPTNGMLSSKVYDYQGTGGGPSETAVGREPVVRAELRDVKNNKLVAVRYIKLQFAQKALEDLAPFTFPEHLVTCKNVEMLFGTEDMNKSVYRELALQGISKEQFHNDYKSVKIVKLTQDGVEITNANSETEPIFNEVYTGSIINPNPTTKDYSLGLLEDQDGNTSYNLRWTMKPSAIAKLKEINKANQNYKSTYELYFQFVSASGSRAINMKFIVNIKAPVQTFSYDSRFWEKNQAGKLFNVNPIVYRTSDDGAVPPRGAGLVDYSHIDADLMSGYLYKPTNVNPTSVAQFIQQIRECADVKFVFDETRFGQYAHLAGYQVVKGVELWKGTPVTPIIATTDRGAVGGQKDTHINEFAYIQDVAMAASITNFFGATALENHLINLPFDEYNEPLISGNNEALGRIRLHETDRTIGTPGALELIGKKVPVNLEVEYNKYNVIPVEIFEVFFINPLTMDGTISGNFKDAVIDGSYLDAQKGLTFRDWNKYLVGQKTIPTTTPGYDADKDAYPVDLWNYYVVNNVKYEVDKVTSNLAWVGNVLTPTTGVETGPLPGSKTYIEQFIYNDVTGEYDKTTVNPTHLGYFNYDGSPVSQIYKLFIPVTVNYKWGVIRKPGVEVSVYPSDWTQP